MRIGNHPGRRVVAVKNIWQLAGKEIYAMFVSPIAYVVLTSFLLLGGWFFFNLLFRFASLLALYNGLQNVEGLSRLNLNEHVMAPLLHNLSIMLIFIVPLITMGTIAEEKKNGTDELLLTSPVSVSQIILGKFLGVALFILVMISVGGVYPVILLIFGNPERGILLSGYFGLLLLALSFASVGLLTSSMTENQIIAAVSSFVTLLLLYTLSWPADKVGAALGRLLEYLAIVDHFGSMVRGIVDTRDLTYFATLILASLFFSRRCLESSRWR